MGIDIGAKLPEPTIVTGSDISAFWGAKGVRLAMKKWPATYQALATLKSSVAISSHATSSISC